MNKPPDDTTIDPNATLEICAGKGLVWIRTSNGTHKIEILLDPNNVEVLASKLRRAAQLAGQAAAGGN